MQAPAIDDHVSTTLYAWYTLVSEWEPPGKGSTGICRECAESALAVTIDIAAWPHDVIHALVESLRSVVRDVHDSYCEETERDSTPAPEGAGAAVRATLVRHAPDIIDVLKHCVSDRIDTWVAIQVEESVGVHAPNGILSGY